LNKDEWSEVQASFGEDMHEGSEESDPMTRVVKCPQCQQDTVLRA